MTIITDLTVQKRNPERVSVFLDGQFAFGLAASVAVELKVGQSLSTEQIERLQNEEELEKARKIALRYISYRPRSEFELRAHFRKKSLEADVIDQVVSDLAALELLDDLAFANYWIEQRETFRPRSRFALGQELRQKGISREIIDAVLEQVDEVDAARRVAEKRATRLAGLPEPEFRSKLAGYLQRRGFSYEVISEIVDDTWQGLE